MVALGLITALGAFALLRFGLGRTSSDSTRRLPIEGETRKKAGHIPERRRNERIACQVRVFVYGHTSLEEEPFYEEATTSEVSASGGLLALTAPVLEGQRLLLTNMVTQEDRECRVVRWIRNGRPRGHVAFEFAQPAPNFWQTPSVAFRVVRILEKQG